MDISNEKWDSVVSEILSHVTNTNNKIFYFKDETELEYRI